MTTTVAEPDVQEELSVEQQSMYTEEEFAALEESFKAELKCSVVHYSCYNCKFYTAKCNHPASVLVIKSCGCRMPVCEDHASSYRDHFAMCVTPRLKDGQMWRCAWCRKWTDPHGFEHQPI